MSAMIFWVSIKGSNKGTVVEDGQTVGWSEGGFLLSHQADQVSFSHQLHELQRSAEVPLVPKTKGIHTVDFEPDGGRQCSEGSILVEADRIDDLFPYFTRVLHNY